MAKSRPFRPSIPQTSLLTRLQAPVDLEPQVQVEVVLLLAQLILAAAVNLAEVSDETR